MLVAATVEASQLMDWPEAGGGAQYACPAPAGAGCHGNELTPSGGEDVISEDWFVRFSEYRLEDYYAVQVATCCGKI